MVLVVSALANARADRRMMGHLLCKVCVLFRLQLKRLTQDRVEWFARPIVGTLVLGNTEACDVANSQDLIVAKVSSD